MKNQCDESYKQVLEAIGVASTSSSDSKSQSAEMRIAKGEEVLNSMVESYGPAADLPVGSKRKKRSAQGGFVGEIQIVSVERIKEGDRLLHLEGKKGVEVENTVHAANNSAASGGESSVTDARYRIQILRECQQQLRGLEHELTNEMILQ